MNLQTQNYLLKSAFLGFWMEFFQCLYQGVQIAFPKKSVLESKKELLRQYWAKARFNIQQ